MEEKLFDTDTYIYKLSAIKLLQGFVTYRIQRGTKEMVVKYTQWLSHSKQTTKKEHNEYYKGK